MEKINKLLYIGTSHDLYPIYTFEHIKEFVYIDTYPRGPWSLTQKFKKKYYDKEFYIEIKQNMYQYGFILDEIIELDKTYTENTFTIFEKMYYSCFGLPKYVNPLLLIFYCTETNQTVKYYISTNIIHNKNKYLMYDIKESNALLVSDFIPSERILDYFDKERPKIFLGYTNHRYHSPRKVDTKKEGCNLLHYLYKNLKNDYFSAYFTISRKNPDIDDCQSYPDIMEMNKACNEPINKSIFYNIH